MYLILKKIPIQKISDKDITLIIIIIIIGFICVDCLCVKKTQEHFSDSIFSTLINAANAITVGGGTTNQECTGDPTECPQTTTTQPTQPATTQPTQAGTTQPATTTQTTQPATTVSSVATNVANTATNVANVAATTATVANAVNNASTTVANAANTVAAITNSNSVTNIATNAINAAITAANANTEQNNQTHSNTQTQNTQLILPASIQQIINKVQNNESISMYEYVNATTDISKLNSTQLIELYTQSQKMKDTEETVVLKSYILKLATPILLAQQAQQAQQAQARQAQARQAQQAQQTQTNQTAQNNSSLLTEIESKLNMAQQQLSNQKSTNIESVNNERDKMAIKYFEILLLDLTEKGILDNNDIENIKLKLKSNLISLDDIISSLETMKLEGKPKKKEQTLLNKVNNDFVYNELPSDFFKPLGDKIANDWDNDYTILNTNKWQVPVQRPPLCINTAPCKVCPSDSSNYPVTLKSWDDSRYVSTSNINKAWANNN